jgi:hypothetical protein
MELPYPLKAPLTEVRRAAMVGTPEREPLQARPEVRLVAAVVATEAAQAVAPQLLAAI